MNLKSLSKLNYEMIIVALFYLNQEQNHQFRR